MNTITQILLISLVILTTPSNAEELKSQGKYISISYMAKDGIRDVFIPMGVMNCQTGQRNMDKMVKQELQKKFEVQNPNDTNLIPKDAFVKSTATEFGYGCIEVYGLKPDPSYIFQLGNLPFGSYYLHYLSSGKFEIQAISKDNCEVKRQVGLRVQDFYECFDSDQLFYF